MLSIKTETKSSHYLFPFPVRMRERWFILKRHAIKEEENLNFKKSLKIINRSFFEEVKTAIINNYTRHKQRLNTH